MSQVQRSPRNQTQQNSQPSALQSSLSVLLSNIKQQLLQNSVIQSQKQLSNIFTSTEKSVQTKDSFYVENFSNLVNYLIVLNIQERERSESMMQQLTQTVQNDRKIIQGLEVFAQLTHKMAEFAKDVYKDRQNQERTLPVEICKHFRQVYELTEELSGVFNEYTFDKEEMQAKREELISLQIRCMQDVFLSHQEQALAESELVITPNASHVNKNSKDQETQSYILSLREEISHLHQTLLRNDEEFTAEIQNYNKTLREMSNTIKAYEMEFAKLTTYEMRVQQLEKLVVRLREEKYRNQIVIENMAKKIRNYEKELKGDRAFISPQRQRLVSSPESKFSMLNSKVANTLSVANSVNMLNNSNGNVPNLGIQSPNNSNLLASPIRKSFF